MQLHFICPLCKLPLEREETGPTEALFCPHGHHYLRRAGIWQMLPPERENYYASFLEDYQDIRQQEGRGSDAPAFYRALPFQDLSGRFSDQWKVRARSYAALLDHLLKEKEARGQSLLVADLGSGNGWLSYRLSQRGHRLAAVDLCDNDWDGLGALRHYPPAEMEAIRAEFDALPLAAEQFDLLIYNASFHYSIDYQTTLKEGMRILKARGQLAIMDSPVYGEAASGERMLQENRAQLLKRFGRAGDSLPLKGYLSREELKRLGSWREIEPDYGWNWKLRPWMARLLRRREPARFAILVLQKENWGKR